MMIKNLLFYANCFQHYNLAWLQLTLSYFQWKQSRVGLKNVALSSYISTVCWVKLRFWWTENQVFGMLFNSFDKDCNFALKIRNTNVRWPPKYRHDLMLTIYSRSKLIILVTVCHTSLLMSVLWIQLYMKTISPVDKFLYSCHLYLCIIKTKIRFYPVSILQLGSLQI